MDDVLLTLMKNPTFYSKTTRVDYVETHISHVFLTKNHVYKVKKPVDFGFLDFSTLEKRKHFCEEELRLNSRYSKDLYLEVVPIFKSESGDYSLSEDGEIAEYAVKMKRLPDNALMSKLLDKDLVQYNHLRSIAKSLTDYYKEAPSSEEVRSYGTIEAMKKLTDQNFEQTEKYIGDIISQEQFDFLKESTNSFYERKKKLFQHRIDEGKIIEFHGDLHCGNIFLVKDLVYIFDCIEFNKEFRFGDVGNDIGFLAMDLDIHDKMYFSKYLISKYVDMSEDYTLYAILDFYKCYRAYVRGKVSCFMSDNPDLRKKEKDDLIKTARKYFDKANDYAQTFSNQKAALVIGSGFPATGKSRWLKITSDILNASIIRTDSVRRKMFNLTGQEEKNDEFYAKYYTEEKKKQVYDKVFEHVEQILSMGGKIAFDAAFHTKEMRSRAADIAKKHNADFIIINTNASEKVIIERIETRSKTEENVSDANATNSLKFFKENYEIPEESEGMLIKLDTEKDDYKNLQSLRKELKSVFDIKSKN